jgi:hypothetical protein
MIQSPTEKPTKFSSYIDREIWEQVGEREKQTGKSRRQIIEAALSLFLSIPPEIELQIDREIRDSYLSKLRKRL